MKNIIMACAIGMGIFALVQDVSAQSGSRNIPRRTRRTPSLEESQRIQQENLARQQATAYANRLATLQRLASKRNGSENKRQYAKAFKQAKKEFMAIKQKTISVSGRRLDQLFVLPSKDVNRVKRSIKWPKPLLDDQHADLVKDIESGLMERELTTAEVHELLSELSVQLEERIKSKSIEIKEYATAKRFISGLANEAEL